MEEVRVAEAGRWSSRGSGCGKVEQMTMDLSKWKTRGQRMWAGGGDEDSGSM